MSDLKISAVVHTRNSAETIEKALQSLAWADEILVVDMQSDDATAEIAQRYASEVIPTPAVPRVDGVRNQYISRCAHDWVFVLDSDEYLADDAGPALRQCIERHGGRYDAFGLPRYNYICGQLLHGSRWYPDYQIRLFRRGKVLWPDSLHEPPVVTSGPHRQMDLTPPQAPHIHHRNYADMREFLRRQLDYALADNYPSDPAAFEFSGYIAAAYEELASRSDPENDGDLSHALALAMAWDQITRGLIHWDSLEPRPDLGYYGALPVATEKVPWWRLRFNRLTARHYPFGYFARKPREMLRWWRWKRQQVKGG